MEDFAVPLMLREQALESGRYDSVLVHYFHPKLAVPMFLSWISDYYRR
jgi:hypothetical protein